MFLWDIFMKFRLNLNEIKIIQWILGKKNYSCHFIIHIIYNMNILTRVEILLTLV